MPFNLNGRHSSPDATEIRWRDTTGYVDPATDMNPVPAELPDAVATGYASDNPNPSRGSKALVLLADSMHKWLRARVETKEITPGSGPVTEWSIPTSEDGVYEILMVFAYFFDPTATSLKDFIVWDPTTKFLYQALEDVLGTVEEPASVSDTAKWKKIVLITDYPMQFPNTGASFLYRSRLQYKDKEWVMGHDSFTIANRDACSCQEEHEADLKQWMWNLLYFTGARFAAGHSQFEKADKYIKAVDEIS